MVRSLRRLGGRRAPVRGRAGRRIGPLAGEERPLPDVGAKDWRHRPSGSRASSGPDAAAPSAWAGHRAVEAHLIALARSYNANDVVEDGLHLGVEDLTWVVGGQQNLPAGGKGGCPVMANSSRFVVD